MERIAQHPSENSDVLCSACRILCKTRLTFANFLSSAGQLRRVALEMLIPAPQLRRLRRPPWLVF